MKQSILIVDADFRFTDEMKNDPRIKDHPVIATSDGKVAQLTLSDRKNKLSGVFINPNVRFDPNWLSIVRCSFMNRPTLPIYIILDKDKTLEIKPEESHRLGIKESIKKPINYSQMVDLVAPITLSFDGQAALQKARELEAANPSGVLSDAGYIAINAEDFLSGTNSIFDVFIRLGPSKYIKLLTAGDSFTVDRLEKYLKKGVTHFYIRKEVQELYLSYCDHLASAIVKSDAAPKEFKLSQVMNHGEEVMKHFKAQGVSDANIKYATSFVSNVRTLATQLGETKNTSLTKFLKNATLYEHGVATAMLAGVLANAMEVSSDKPAEIIGLAALLHDSALALLPEKFQDEDESQMTYEERTVYQQHPELAADNLRNIGKIDPAAIQAISQHHMRLGGRGFPIRAATTVMSRVSEIIGICDEAANAMVRAEKDKTYDIDYDLDTRIYPSFSRQLVQTFKTTFYPNKPPKD